MAASESRPTTLNFITGNANKLSEVRAILGHVEGLDVRSRDVPGLFEIQGTIEEVARDKCSRAAQVVRVLKFDGFDVDSPRYEPVVAGWHVFYSQVWLAVSHDFNRRGTSHERPSLQRRSFPLTRPLYLHLQYPGD